MPVEVLVSLSSKKRQDLGSSYTSQQAAYVRAPMGPGTLCHTPYVPAHAGSVHSAGPLQQPRLCSDVPFLSPLPEEYITPL